MTAELFIPFWYSVKRDVIRFKLPILNASLEYLASLLEEYLWIPLYAMLLLNSVFELSNYYYISVYILTFMILYEIGYLICDNIGIRFERKTMQRPVFSVSIVATLSAVLVRILVLGLIYVSMDHLFKTQFLTLHALKGIAPYIFLLIQLPIYGRALIFSGLLFVAIFDSMEYSIRKLTSLVQKNHYKEKNFIFRFLIILLLTATVSLLFQIQAQKLLFFVAVIAGYHIFVLLLRILKSKLLNST